MFILALSQLPLLNSVGMSVLWAALGSVLLIASVKLIDIIAFPKICFNEELQKGNIGVAIVMGAILISVGFIIGISIM